MSDYFRQNAVKSNFSSSESWVVLSSIEKEIKKKIESVGTPLKDWDININYGIKTGYNEAFIIDGIKRKELIEMDSKSAEIIRPLLRGRDIKRYDYDFSDLYIITTFPSLKIDIEKYPAIKQHLTSFGYDRLNQTGELGGRKKTNNQWFETQDTISYWEDFYRPKIIYPEITKFLNFYYDENEFLVNNKCFILTGKYIHFLTAFFNSSLFKYCFIDSFPELIGGTRELRKIFLEKIHVILIDDNIDNLFRKLIKDLQYSKSINETTIEIEKKIDQAIFDLYKLSDYEKNEIGFIEIQ